MPLIPLPTVVFTALNPLLAVSLTLDTTPPIFSLANFPTLSWTVYSPNSLWIYSSIVYVWPFSLFHLSRKALASALCSSSFPNVIPILLRTVNTTLNIVSLGIILPIPGIAALIPWIVAARNLCDSVGSSRIPNMVLHLADWNPSVTLLIIPPT